MKRRNAIFLLIFFSSLQVKAYDSLELKDLAPTPDESKVYRRPAVVPEEFLSQHDDLKKDVNENLEKLDSTTKVLKNMGVVNPDCADCESLTNKKNKGRSPALEISP